MCWVLTVLFWMYFGLYYFLDKFASDTCAALEEYQLNPKNSTLGAIIPCSEKMSGSVILHDVGAGIHDIIDQVTFWNTHSVITNSEAAFRSRADRVSMMHPDCF